MNEVSIGDQSNQGPNPDAEQWQDMGKPEGSDTETPAVPEVAKEITHPMIGDEVSNGYKIASMPFEDKSDAYNFMREYQYGDGYTTYYDASSRYWFIVTK